MVAGWPMTSCAWSRKYLRWSPGTGGSTLTAHLAGPDRTEELVLLEGQVHLSHSGVTAVVKREIPE